MKYYCSNCGEILPINGFVITSDKRNICLKCGKKLFPAVFESLSIYIFEDGIPGIILPHGILIPKEISNSTISTVSNVVLESYYRQIVEKTKFTFKEIENLVERKIKAFSGLVSEETALRLIAHDLNIRLRDL